MILSADVIARIDALELAAKQVVEGYLAGRHRSPRHGFAVEFAQHREYAAGDDIRHIDWKVFARTERYHLKQYEQETNLIAWLIVDQSESMRVGTVPRQAALPGLSPVVTKFEVAGILAAALGYLALQQTDSVGLATIAAGGKLALRPSSQPGQIRELLRILAEGPTTDAAQTGRALRELGGMLGRRGIVFLFSDLLDDVEEFAAGLRVLRSQKHEVVVFQILDAAELDFPFHHPTLFRGLEQQPELSTDPLTIREHYLREFQQHLRMLESVCRATEADYVRVRTDANLGAILAGYLQKRRGK
jgi:uncharacterized protein (DUF58 family)